MRRASFASTLIVTFASFWNVGAIAEPVPDSVAAAEDSLRIVSPTTAHPASLDDSTLTALSHAFRHQVVAAVYYHGRRYEVANPKIQPDGFAYRRITTPGHVTPGDVPDPIPWADVDSLLLRRTYATGLGTATAVTMGALGGLWGWGLGATLSTGAQFAGAFVLGAAGVGLGFLAGGFLGGWVQYWTQVYPEMAPYSAGQVVAKSGARR
jgi:hypothetical protein